MSFSQHPDFSHTLVHLSDTHVLAGERKLYGSIDTDAILGSFLSRLVESGQGVDALVFTGDLADRGEEDAYLRLKNLVEPFAERLGAQIIWVMGNHDEIPTYSKVLFGGSDTDTPQDRVYDLRGLRVISLDTSVPGFHHGEVAESQLEWLSTELKTSAPHGTLLALHHPPIPTPVSLMGLIELENQAALADVVRGTDVRGVLGGHLHYGTFSQFAGVPVSVAPASCYNIDLVGPAGRILSAKPTGRASSLVHIFPEHVVFSAVTLEDDVEFGSFAAEEIEGIRAMTPEQRRAVFSAKDSDFNRRVDQNQAGD